MAEINHLALQHVRLAPGDTWIGQGSGLLLVWVRGGRLICRAPGQVHSLAPGDVITVNGAVCAQFTLGRGKDARFSWFLTRVENLYPLFQGAEISILNRVVDGFSSPKRYAGTSDTARECRSLLDNLPPDHRLDHRSQLLRVITTVLSPEISDLDPTRLAQGAADERFLRAVDAISSDEFVTLAVTELAQRFGYGRRHLNRLFHKHFGVSVAALRMEMRLTKAVSLLRDPQSKVSNIAMECGFNHMGLFNACFKKRFGVSPGLWRKANPDPTNSPHVTTRSLAQHLRESKIEVSQTDSTGHPVSKRPIDPNSSALPASDERIEMAEVQLSKGAALNSFSRSHSAL